jgi:protein-tyrosine phosphatase
MISYVTDHLYIGEQVDAQSPPPFISAVFWTALDPPLTAPPNIIFGRLPLREYTEPDLIDLEMGIQWLARHLPEHNVLVACRVGLGRSPSLIIAYLCCMQGLSFAEAQELVTQKRPGTTALPHLAAVIEQVTTLAPIR